ncbi:MULTISPECIES: branched-chain amino acid ABC transporter permease [Undibacterium]|jgi:branched-chain amino acid transport system permease protein|uniref:Branched-chain amino acid ABC transporter permease n=1 Tax=Undibacterium aquatile TaxID=1537398 RepID=A0ABR6XIU5_9BURK|nr:MULTISPECIES: branched-chain amino acid ABC transporter permease [Undibacterium]MBC3812807.1 branched-chain amino acid ABC transporter permease [Undibacterium aquatile]MBK1891144.1 branched-chain amino acid ABC transporter permease [Undibacterium sp. 14-3-2]
MLEWWDGFWAIYSTVIFGIGINAMLALSIYLTLSCGLLSLANAAFMGIGAYAASMISMQTELAFPVALLAAGVAPALVALAVGIPTLRLSGVYLAMATLGFGEVVRVIVLNMEITGGPMGLNGIPLKTEWWHIVVILGITLFVLARLRRSKTGRAFEAIKEDEIAARLMGVNVAGYKLLAFVLGAVIAGVAGGLNAHYTFTIGPGNYAFENAVEILTMAVFGGTSNLIGPVLGSTILTLLPEVMRSLKDYRLAANGLILIIVILYLPKGIWDPAKIRALRRKFTSSKSEEVA